MAFKSSSSGLTVLRVKSLTEPGKYHDGNGTGLFLRIRKGGSRQWIQRLNIRGKPREIGLGSPPAVSLATARTLALENKGTAMLGGDPLEDKRQKRETLNFADAVDRYLAKKLNEFRNEKHRKQWRSTLDQYAIPKLGTRRVADIDVQDVLKVLEPIWQTKTVTAKRVRGRIENVLSWATVAGHRKGDNPARWKGNLSEILPKPSKVAKGGNHPALSQSDAPRWWADLCSRDGMGARALQFAALTAARSGEVRGMIWSELSNDEWNIPKARMKNNRPHRVPLTKEARDLLDALPRLEGADFVFFAPKGGKLSDMALSGVMRRMHKADIDASGQGYVDLEIGRPAVPHGLRSTFRQWAAEKGFPREMAEIALAHFIGSDVERAYQRSDMLERRREMMAAWSAFLDSRDYNLAEVIPMNGAK